MFPVFSDLYVYAGGWPLGTVIKSQNIIVTATYMHIYVCIYIYIVLVKGYVSAKYTFCIFMY